jgi:translation initiation factor 6 (eIF-6)
MVLDHANDTLQDCILMTPINKTNTLGTRLIPNTETLIISSTVEKSKC